MFSFLNRYYIVSALLHYCDLWLIYTYVYIQTCDSLDGYYNTEVFVLVPPHRCKQLHAEVKLFPKFNCKLFLCLRHCAAYI